MGVDVFDTLDESSMKCIRFDVCKLPAADMLPHVDVSSMKCIRFDVCKDTMPGTSGVAGFVPQ